MTSQTRDTHRDDLDALDALVGRWDLESSLGPTDGSVQAQASFEWLEGRTFLIQRWHIDLPDAPDGIAVIGYDEDQQSLLQHYFDSRGVSRVYEMSLRDGTWRLERSAPGFSQRYSGVFDASGDTIAGSWELSKDGKHWAHDFDLTYRRAR